MKCKITIGIRILCVVLIYIFTLSTFAYGDYTSPEKRKIIIGGDYTYPPYEFIDDRGNPAGFCVDLSNAIAEIMNVNVEIRLDKWANIIKELKDGNIDTLQGMYFSEERNEIFDFSTPHSIVHHSVFIVKGAQHIKSIEELHGKSIVTLNADIMHDYIVENNITDKLTVADNYVDVLKLLQTGNYDCAIMAKISALYWIKKLNIKNIEPVGPPILPKEYCYSVLNGDKELLSIINEGLVLLKDNGTYAQIYNKWLGVLDPKGVPKETIIRYALYIGTPLIAAVILTMLWSWSLKKQVISRTKELQLSINQLKKTETELRESDKKLSTIIENIAEGIIVYAQDGSIIIANNAACEILGLTKEELFKRNVGHSSWKFINRDGSECDSKATPVAQVYEEQEVVRNTFYGVLRPDKSIRWLLGNAAPVFDEASNELIYIVSNFIDITELEEKDKALKDSENRYYSLFLNMQDGFSYHKIIQDESNTPIDFTYIEVNDAFTAITGLKKDQILGKYASNIFGEKPLRDSHILKLFGEVAITGKNLKMDQYITPLDKWFTISAYSPKKEFFVTIINDITDRKRFEKEIIDINEVLERRVIQRTTELTAINKELEAFSYSVSHDLRAPLRSIDGFSQALLEDYEDRLDDQGKSYLNRVRSASQRMAQLIDDLLDLSRITRGDLQHKSIDMSALANAVIDELLSTSPERKSQIIIKESVTANGDERLMKVALENLLGNAWKYTNKNEFTEIEFGMLNKSGKRIYYVKDNGVGFDMRYSNKLFGAFQRLHGALEFEGTGIGLATVQRIINKHGGSIWAESEVGRGSQFFFTLEN